MSTPSMHFPPIQILPLLELDSDLSVEWDGS